MCFSLHLISSWTRLVRRNGTFRPVRFLSTKFYLNLLHVYWRKKTEHSVGQHFMLHWHFSPQPTIYWYHKISTFCLKTYILWIFLFTTSNLMVNIILCYTVGICLVFHVLMIFWTFSNNLLSIRIRFFVSYIGQRNGISWKVNGNLVFWIFIALVKSEMISYNLLFVLERSRALCRLLCVLHSSLAFSHITAIDDRRWPNQSQFKWTNIRIVAGHSVENLLGNI